MFEVSPAAPDALSQAFTAHERGDLAAARNLCLTILDGSCDNFDALSLLASIQSQLGLHQDALENYDRALALRPDSAEAWNARGIALQPLKRWREALWSFDKALALRPNFAEALNNRGVALEALKRPEEALESYDKALALKPDYADAFSNRGNALQKLLRFEEALASYDQALALQPNRENTRWNRIILLLSLGRYAEGWREFDAFQKPETWTARGIDGRPWRGEPLHGRRLLLHAEQALGDTIQFARFAREIAKGGENIALEVLPQLAALLRSLGGVSVVPRSDVPPPHEWQLSLMSTPFALGTALATIPAEVPYLAAEPERVAAWAKRLPASFKIGIAWQGNPLASYDPGRSAPLRAFEPLSQLPGVTLVSLQKNAGVEQLDTLPPNMKVERLGDDFDAAPDAFLDAAAVMASLDLIVTVDSAIAHLAGALGRPVWIALQFMADWRWLIDREDTPWYPTARLFRQRGRGEWGELFERIAVEAARLFVMRCRLDK